MEDSDRETLIRDAIKSASDKNIKLTAGAWGIEWLDKKARWAPKKDQRCCALGCLVLECQDKFSNATARGWRSFLIETLLECDSNWIANFRRGFDGYERADENMNAFPYDIGFILRQNIANELQLKIPGL